MADAVVGRIKAVVTADTSGLTTSLDRASAKLDTFGQNAQRLGRGLTTRLTLPLAGLGAAAFKTASDFEKSMTSISALVGIARDEVKRMETDVRSMAVEFGKSGKDAADALFYITSAGLRGSVATDTLAASLKASAIGLGDTATIADLATSALNAYGADVLSASDATDVMTAAVREGKLEASELAGSMGRVLPLASAMGVNFNEVGAAFAALSRTGTNAAEAATQVRGILSSLLRPTKQAEDALTGMGLSSEGLRKQIQDEGLLATLKTLANEFDGNEAAAAAVFGNIRALSGVLDLMGANVATTEAIFASMADTTGAVDDAFSIMSDTASFKFAQSMAEVKDALLTLGQELLPIVTDALGVISGVVSDLAGFFGGLDDGTKQVVLSLGGMLALAGPLALGIGAVSRALVALKAANPWVLGLTAAFSGLSVMLGAFYREAREARDRQESFTQAMRDANDPAAVVVDRLSKVAESMSLIKGVEPEAEAAFSNFMGGLLLDSEIAKNGVTKAFQDMSAGSLDAIQQFIDAAPTEDQTNFLKSSYVVMEDAIADLEKIATGATGPVAAFAQSLLASGDIANMTVEDLNGVLGAVKNTAVAHADSVADIEASNKAYLTSTQVFEDFGDVLGRSVVQSYIAAAEESGNYTEQTLLLQRALGYADAELQMVSGHIADVAIAASNSIPPFDAFAQTLVDAGDIVGQDITQIAALADQLGILDGMSAELKVELGLDVVGIDAIKTALDELITFYEDYYDRVAAGVGMPLPVNPALQSLRDLREGLESVADAATGGGGGGGGSLIPLPDEDQAQRDLDQFVNSVVGYANRLLGRDFAEALFDGTAEDILSTYRSLMDDVAYMLRDTTDKTLNAVLGDLQGRFAELANLATLRDTLEQQLGDIQSVVDRAMSQFALSLQPDLGPEQMSVFDQAQQQVGQARQFVAALRRLKGLGLPASILSQVVDAGLVNGTIMARQLMSLSPDDLGQLVSMATEMEQLQAEAGGIVGQALGAPGVESELSATVQAMDALTEAIQVDLYTAFSTFITDLGAEIDDLIKPPGVSTPSPAPAPAPAPSPAPAPGGGTSSQYTVKSGDSMWKIAQDLLGSGSRWKEIARLNGLDPAGYGTRWAVHPGQVLQIPARAMGGPVTGSRPYLVGELGPELFVPNASGTIIPHGAYGGDTNISVTVHAGMGTDGAEVGRKIVQVLNEYAQTNSGRLAPSLVR